MNKVILIGYLANDPESQVFLEKDLKRTRFRIAVNDLRSYANAYFFGCVAWNQTADYIANNLKKGDFVAIDGRLTNRSYVDKDGRKAVSTEIIVESIKLIGSKRMREENLTAALNEEKVSIDSLITNTNENIELDNSNNQVDNIVQTTTNNEDQEKNIYDDFLEEWESDLK